MFIHIPKDSGDWDRNICVPASENEKSNDTEEKSVLLSSNYASGFRFRKYKVILN